MSDQNEQSISATLDGVFRKKRGTDQEVDAPTPEQLDEQRRAAEDAAFKRMEKKAESKAATQRLVRARSALLDAVEQLRHGQTYDATERAALVEETVEAMGANLDATQRQHVKSLIAKAADSIADGDKIEALRAVDDTAEAVASGSGKIGAPTAPKPGDDVTDPAELAAMIGRP
jgi:hypothetical protein